jgi:tripartite-type tricarboxylate transporter receptor subunit TctC
VAHQADLLRALSYTPDGGSNMMARMVGQPAAEMLAKSIFVDNKPGDSCNISTPKFARDAQLGRAGLAIL